MKKIILMIFFVSTIIILNAQVRAVWAPVWDITNPYEIDRLIADAKENNFNTIIPEIRYRGDAFYFPNKIDSTNYTEEVHSWLIADKNFDPLEYLIAKAHEESLKVAGWMTVFVASPHDVSRLPENHVVFNHPEWITKNSKNQTMKFDEREGAFFDAGNPEVIEYMASVIRDIVTNYELDELHLDYLRYPGPRYGYNELALKNYRETVEFEDDNSFQKWKIEQISNFVKRVNAEIKNINPNIILSSAVYAKYEYAKRDYSQDWLEWLKLGIIDRVYLMAYTVDDAFMKGILQAASVTEMNDKIVIGLRAWTDGDYKYPVEKIITKAKMCDEYNFAGTAYFHYSEMKKKKYLSSIKSLNISNELHDKKENIKTIYGKIYDKNNQLIKNTRISLNDKDVFTDANGFYSFDNLQDGIYNLSIYKNNGFLGSQEIQISKNNFSIENNIYENDFLNKRQFNIEQKDDNVRIEWNYPGIDEVLIYRCEIFEENGNSLYRLIADVKEDTKFLNDFSVLQNKTYRYKLTDVSGRILDIENITIKQDEIFEITVFTNPKTNEINFEFNLNKSGKLNWKLLSEDGSPILSHNSWYEKGKTTENWNGVTVSGNLIRNGVYTFYCFSETFLKEFKQKIVINFES